jgi:antitoxin HicB
MTREYNYTVVYEPSDEGGYVVFFPEFPNLATQGETLEEARAMAADCLRGYLETLRENGETPPDAPKGKAITESVRVALESA